MALNQLKTHADVSREFGVTTRTVSAWVEYDGWPGRGVDGTFDRPQIDAFCRLRGVGPYSKSKLRDDGGDDEAATLTAARIKLTIEQAENERIKKERQLVEQATELELVLDRDDASHAVSQMVATARQCIDALHTAVDRAIPDEAEFKEGVLGLISKLDADVFTAMTELW